MGSFMQFGDRRWVAAIAIRVCLFTGVIAASGWARSPPALDPPICPTASVQALHLPATRMAVAGKQPVVVIAFGSSSTEGAGASTPDATYPAQLEGQLRAAWPGVPVTVLNRGRGGQTSLEMLARIEADVLRATPTLVIWQVGGNALLTGLNQEVFAALTHEGTQELISRGIDVVLMDNQYAPRILAKPHHQTYGDIVAEVAATLKVSLFSRTQLMREWTERMPDGPPMIGSDGLHHTDHGYACLAAALGRSVIYAVASALTAQTSAVPALK